MFILNPAAIVNCNRLVRRGLASLFPMEARSTPSTGDAPCSATRRPNVLFRL